MAGFGGWLRGAGLRLADHFVSGNNYNRETGQWSATPGQYLTGIGGKVAGIFNPLLGLGISKGADYFYNHQGNPGSIPQAQFPTNPSVNVPDLNGSYNMSGGSLGFPSYNPFATPSGSTNPYDGLMPEGTNMFDPTGTFSGNPGYSGGGSTGNGGMNWAQNAGGGTSQGGGIGHGWTGVSGDAARGMYQGMVSASDAALQAYEAAQAKKLRV